jgi:hypothetical protein
MPSIEPHIETGFEDGMTGNHSCLSGNTRKIGNSSKYYNNEENKFKRTKEYIDRQRNEESDRRM